MQEAGLRHILLPSTRWQLRCFGFIFGLAFMSSILLNSVPGSNQRRPGFTLCFACGSFFSFSSNLPGWVNICFCKCSDTCLRSRFPPPPFFPVNSLYVRSVSLHTACLLHALSVLPLSVSLSSSVQTFPALAQVHTLRRVNECLLAENRAMLRVLARLSETASMPETEDL